MIATDHRIVKAARGLPVDRTPVWFMRQAGRYLPEYRDVRKKHDFLQMCHTPEIAAEITLQPLRRFPDLDAAILFSDLLVPFPSMGLDLEFISGTGPVIHNPVRSAADVDRLCPVDPDADLAFVAEAIRIVKEELADRVPLLGFAGAPFTLASYAVEGGASRTHARTKALMAEDPAAWSRLLEKIADTTRLCLKAQAEAGVDMVQVFDSWAGALDRTDYVNSVLPATRHLFGALKDSLSLPVVNFSTGTAGIIEEVASAGGDVLGVDWRMPLDRVHERIGGRPLQGNLDPVALLSDEKSLLARVDRILDEARDLPGHIFNLGHGVLPQTDPDRIAAVIRRVHERTRA